MLKSIKELQSLVLVTPIGPMLAQANREGLLLLKFMDLLDNEPPSTSTPTYAPLLLIKEELESYFQGILKVFKTPVLLEGSPFRIQVWEELRKIPFGKTCSYEDLACAAKNPKACRAVGSANKHNQFAILLPCHRVIQKKGQLGGYAGGLERKKWLLRHEGIQVC